MTFTPSKITQLKANQIFVFGSNEGGIHGAGAARDAMKWGAKWHQCYGLMGNTFGIPTKPKNLRQRLTINEIREYVDKFCTFAKSNKSLEFLVTEIGCGYSGYSPQEIGPLFKNCLDLENIILPKSFVNILDKESFN